MPFLAQAGTIEAGLSGVLDSYRPEAAAPPHQRTVSSEDLRQMACGNPECGGGWLRSWKRLRRPVFEGKWGCGAKCVNALVEAALRRERGDGWADTSPHRHRVPLGLVLLAQGWITHPQLQQALDSQRRTGSGRIGRWLIEDFGIAEECVTRALSVQWSRPVLSLEGFAPSAMALAMPRVLVERLRALPLRVAAERILYVGFEDEIDASTAAALERMSGLRVESGLVDATQLRAARERMLDCPFIECKEETVADAEALGAAMVSTLRELQPRASRLVRVREFYWLRMWLERGAMRTEDGGLPAGLEDVVDRVWTLG